MKILYAGHMAEGTSSLYRLRALKRLGHEVVRLDLESEYRYQSPLLHKVAFRLAAGPQVERLNRDLLRLAEECRPELFWADKVLALKPETLEKMRAKDIRSVSYMIDNAFGPRSDPGWRLYYRCIPGFDLHVTQRDVNLAEYRRAGARNVMKVQTAYEPTVHFPPPLALADRDRTREVSFIGTPYDDRAAVLEEVSRAGIPLAISGNPRAWQRALSAEGFARLFREGELYDTKYRETIWRSKINLSFLTRSNQDEYTHKSFEIAGCGGFLLAERSRGHTDRFIEGEEAAFFSGPEELIAQIRRYLPDEAARSSIAAAGRLRAARDGYYNDAQIRLILERMDDLRGVVEV